MKMAFRMRSSKFRHVFGTPAKKELCYEYQKITKNAHDGNYCAVNPKFVAMVTESEGGGAFLVLPLERTGRIDISAPKVCGHSGPVLDIKWNPFSDHVIASCSDDATIKLWQIPEGGLRQNLTEWLVDLHGHDRRVGHIEWHPTAENILLSAGYDMRCILWNTETAEPINIISVHTDTIFSISWNREGSMFATTSKDKRIRVIEPREGNIVAEGQGHQGSKPSKVVFLGDRNRLFTTGFSRMSERQYAVWDIKSLNKPLKMETVDSSSGILFPYYDHDTRVVFVAGKGDGNIRYYEMVDEPPYSHYLSQYQSASPQRGLGIMPKRGMDVLRCEIVRFYKLHAVKGICEPISMIVPRKSEMFQEDIFVPTASACPSLTADEWLNGQNREPILISLKDNKQVTVVSQPKTTTTKSSQRKDSAIISNAPTITTYKAVKRATPSVVTTGSPNEQRLKRQATTPPMATVQPTSPNKMPLSLRNIQKLSSVEEANRQLQQQHQQQQQHHQQASIETHIRDISDDTFSSDIVNDKINSFEKKTAIKQPTRIQPIKLDKKGWGHPFNSNYSNDVSATNGNLTTDAEPLTGHEASPPSSPKRQHSPLRQSQKSAFTAIESRKPREPSPQRVPSLQRGSPTGSRKTSQTTSPPFSPEALEKAEEELYASLKIQSPPVKKQGPPKPPRMMSRADSDASDVFDTPPTSPLKSRESSPRHAPFSPTTPSSLVSAESSPSHLQNSSAFSPSYTTSVNISSLSTVTGSPMSWNENPIYGNDPEPVTKMEDTSPHGHPNNTAFLQNTFLERDSVFRRSLRSGQRPNLEKRNPVTRNQSFSEYERRLASQKRSTFLPRPLREVPRKSSEPGTNSGSIQNHQSDNHEEGFIDPGVFPSHAPDDTLIKPSKLRESMRSKRRNTATKVQNHDINDKSQEDANNNVNKNGTVIISNEHDSSKNTSNASSPTLHRVFSPLLIGSEPCHRGSIASSVATIEDEVVNNRNHAFCSPEPSWLRASSPYDNLPAPRTTSNTSVELHLLSPSGPRSERSPRTANGVCNNIHVKKVWSPQSPPSPEIPKDVAMQPQTDPELRKAYFRQVEELKSLKEQISLKDKRIRQLEEEVRLLRTDSRDAHGDESTC